MSTVREMQDDLEYGPEADLPAQLQWNGRRFPCSHSARRKSSVLEIGGFQVHYDFSMRVRFNARSLDGYDVLFGDTEFPEEVDLPDNHVKIKVLMHGAEDLPANLVEYRVNHITNAHQAFLILYLEESGA